MGYLLKKSQTATPLLFLMVDDTDHITGKTGLTPTVTISKNGGGFAAPSGAVSEVGNGWYKVAGNSTDSDTLGPLILNAVASGADPCDEQFEVVSFDPQDAVRMGLTAIPNVEQGNDGQLATADADGLVSVGGVVADNILVIKEIVEQLSTLIEENDISGSGVYRFTYTAMSKST